MDQCDTKINLVKYVGHWPIFHGPLILPYIIVIDLNYFYTLRHGAGQGYSVPPGTCSSLCKFSVFQPSSHAQGFGREFKRRKLPNALMTDRSTNRH